MNVFLTGAGGYVGSAVAASLLAAGHRVTALARSDASAARLHGRGLRTVLGDLRAPETYRNEAAAHDAIAHLALEYDAAGNEAADVDSVATSALLEAARTRGGAFVYTSNAFLVADLQGGAVREDIDASCSTHPGRWRLERERAVLDAASGSLATAVVRVGAVYGGTGGCSFPDFFLEARDHGYVSYADEGAARWSLIHRDDLAALYRAILERRAGGVFHGVDGAPMALRDVAETVAGVAGVRARSLPLAAAREQLPHWSEVMRRDLAAETPRALALGWRPAYASFAVGALGAYEDWCRQRR